MALPLIKVRFELDANDWHSATAERLWAEPLAGVEQPVFRLQNSPFYALGIAYLDIVEAIPDEDPQTYAFKAVVERSGHSTYMLLLKEHDSLGASYWERLASVGCSYESTRMASAIGPRLLYSVDVPATTNLQEVYLILKQGEGDGAWLFQEGYAHIKPSWEDQS